VFKKATPFRLRFRAATTLNHVERGNVVSAGALQAGQNGAKRHCGAGIADTHILLACLAALMLLTDPACGQDTQPQPPSKSPVPQAPDAKPPTNPPPGGYRLPPICLQHPSIPLCPHVSPVPTKAGG
jgi:hypothetical protein